MALTLPEVCTLSRHGWDAINFCSWLGDPTVLPAEAGGRLAPGPSSPAGPGGKNREAGLGLPAPPRSAWGTPQPRTAASRGMSSGRQWRRAEGEGQSRRQGRSREKQ